MSDAAKLMAVALSSVWFAICCPSVQGADQQAFARGIVMGRPFVMKAASYEGGRKLLLRSDLVETRSAVHVRLIQSYSGIELDFPTDETFEEQTFTIAAGDRGMIVDGKFQPSPTLVRYTLINQIPETWTNQNVYALRLKFFKRVHGMLPGYIDLKVTPTIESPETTTVKGFFYAVPGVW